MHKPKKVKIGYATMTVKFVEDGELRKIASARPKARLYGTFTTRDNTIRIYKHLSRAQMADTFLHECLHAHAHINGIRFKDKSEDRAEETAINCTSAATVELWIRNPKVKKWWDSLF